MVQRTAGYTTPGLAPVLNISLARIGVQCRDCRTSHCLVSAAVCVVPSNSARWRLVITHCRPARRLSPVHIGPVGLENSKLKTARLDLRIYRTCEWNRAESDGITLNQFCSRQYAVTGAFLRWKLLVDNISNYCFDRKFGFTMGYGCSKCTADSNETQTNPNQYLLVKFVWWNVNFL